jgi:hypothetical protein
MYVYLNVVARSRNVYTFPTLTACYHFTRRERFLRLYVAGKSTTYLGLHVVCPIFLSDFNQIWILSTGFNGSLQHRTSRQSVQFAPSWYTQTDRQMERSTEIIQLIHSFWARYLRRYSDWLRAGRSGYRISVRTRFYAPVQTGPEAHQASCIMGTGSFPGVKRPGRSADHPPLSSAEVENE